MSAKVPIYVGSAPSVMDAIEAFGGADTKAQGAADTNAVAAKVAKGAKKRKSNVLAPIVVDDDGEVSNIPRLVGGGAAKKIKQEPVEEKKLKALPISPSTLSKADRQRVKKLEKLLAKVDQISTTIYSMIDSYEH